MSEVGWGAAGVALRTVGSGALHHRLVAGWCAQSRAGQSRAVTLSTSNHAAQSAMHVLLLREASAAAAAAAGTTAGRQAAGVDRALSGVITAGAAWHCHA